MLAAGVRLPEAGVRLLAAGVRLPVAGVRSVVEGVLLLAAGVLPVEGVRDALAALRLSPCTLPAVVFGRAEIWPLAALLEARLAALDGEVRVAEPVRGGVVVVLPSPLEVTVLLFRFTCAPELGAA